MEKFCPLQSTPPTPLYFLTERCSSPSMDLFFYPLLGCRCGDFLWWALWFIKPLFSWQSMQGKKEGGGATCLTRETSVEKIWLNPNIWLYVFISSLKYWKAMCPQGKPTCFCFYSTQKHKTPVVNTFSISAPGFPGGQINCYYVTSSSRCQCSVWPES